MLLIVKIGCFQQRLLTVPGNTFLGAVPLGYLLLKIAFSGTVAVRQPPLKILFRGGCSNNTTPVNYFSVAVAALQPPLKMFYSRTAAPTQQPLKMHLQVQFNEPPLKIRFKLFEFKIFCNIWNRVFLANFRADCNWFKLTSYIHSTESELTNTHMINKVFVAQFQIHSNYKVTLIMLLPKKWKEGLLVCSAKRFKLRMCGILWIRIKE